MRKIARQLRGALRAGAAQSRAVLIAHDGRAADGAFVRQVIGLRALRAPGEHDLENFRDDLACFPDLDGIADADVLIRNKILIVERRGGDGRSGQMHGSDDGARGENARAAHLHDDILQYRLLDLGRVFEGCCPAREFGRAAETGAARKAVELHNGPVDIIRQVIARFAKLGDQLLRFVHIAAERIGNDLEFQISQIVQRLAVGLKFRALCQLQIENQNVQPALCSDTGVELAQRTRRRVARVGKERLSELFLLGVERLEAGAGHKDLAAHDQTGGRVLQRHGDGADGLEIFRYILADQAVAARCAADELSVDIFQRDGETVDLRLDGVFRVRLILAHVRVKVAQLVIGKHVLQAFQRDGVAHLDKFAQRLPADAARRTEGRGVLRVLRLQFFQSAQLVVIVIIAHFGVVEHVIKISGVFQLPCELFNFLFRFHIVPSLPL